MFKASTVCLSALTKRTKRVQVQLLKDFPQFHFFAGEVVQVKPSLMRNFLHNNNGARYILKEGDIDLTLQANAAKSRVSAVSKTRTEPKVKNVKPSNSDKQASKVTEKKEPETAKSALDEGITIENVKIPGLEL